MAALELIAQKDIEERSHFVVDFGIGRLGVLKEHLDELRCYIAGDDLAVLPVIILQPAVTERKLDPFRFLVPTVVLASFSAAVI